MGLSAEGLDVPPGWAGASGQVLDGAVRRVMVLGPVDAGKTSLCRVILAAAAARGRAVRLVDADVGQKMLGPPACVTAAGLGTDGRWGGMEAAFTGTTDPVAGWGAVLEGMRRLSRGPEGLLLVNTGGLLRGPGRRLKAAKIAALEADLLLALGEDPGLEAVLADHPGIAQVRLAPSPLARRRGRGERNAARQAAFREAFAGAGVAELGRQALGPEAPMVPPPPGLLIGLADRWGGWLGLGLVEAVGPAGLSVRSAVDWGRVARGALGRLVLDSSFRDRPARWPGEITPPPPPPAPGWG